MASATKRFKVRKKLKKAAAGRDRKNHLQNYGSTPSKEEFFAGKDR